jgi:hypothetical protein
MVVRERFYGSTIESARHLRIAFSSEDDLIDFDRPPFSLRAQPQRPGELTDLVDVAVAPNVLARVANEGRVGLPRELALYIAVEAERALVEAATLYGLKAAVAAGNLDEAASAIPMRGPQHVLVRPLQEYAAALESGVDQLDESDAAVRVRVPHHVAARWAQSAAASNLSVERWVGQVLERASGARVNWEVAAARSARTLAEWVLVQAARSTRSRSTLPQTTASD